MKTKPCKKCNGTGRQIDFEALGKTMREKRKKASLSLRAVARYMGISPPYLSDLEQGRRAWITHRIAQFNEAVKVK